MGDPQSKNELLLLQLAQALGIKIEQPTKLVPELGKSASLELPDGSLNISLTNTGDLVNMINVSGPNLPKLSIVRCQDGMRAPPEALYAITFPTQGNYPGYRVYLGPSGVIDWQLGKDGQ